MVARSFWATTILSTLLRIPVAGTEPQDCSKFAPPHHLYQKRIWSVSLRPSSPTTGQSSRVFDAFDASNHRFRRRDAISAVTATQTPFISTHHYIALTEFSEPGLLDYCQR